LIIKSYFTPKSTVSALYGIDVIPAQAEIHSEAWFYWNSFHVIPAQVEIQSVILTPVLLIPFALKNTPLQHGSLLRRALL